MYVAICFERDDNKNRSNRAKHGISFDTAVSVFADPASIMRPDLEIAGEQRWQTIGRLDRGLVIVVVAHTLRPGEDDSVIRVISARKATPRERRLYEENEGCN
jgi:uncharacterized DUF497 family protein